MVGSWLLLQGNFRFNFILGGFRAFVGWCVMDGLVYGRNSEYRQEIAKTGPGERWRKLNICRVA